MKKRNDKEYIKQMQKQIVELKKYIVFLENKVNVLNENNKKLEEKNNLLKCYKNTLIAMLFEEVKYGKGYIPKDDIKNISIVGDVK